MLILDTGNNTIYQYDASGLYEYNTVLNNKLIFLNLIGGEGSASDALAFDKPTDIVSCNKKIYVLDTGNKCIKQFDDNLNWEFTYRLFRDFNYSIPKKLKVDSDGNFYVLLSNNEFYVYNNDFSDKKLISLENTLDSLTEQAIDIVFSKSDTNIFYIITTENVYKRFVTKPEVNIGKYLFYLFNFNNSQTLYAMSTFKKGANDFNIIFSKNNNTGIFSSFGDNANLYDILSIPDFDVYTFDEISIDSDEYVQSWVYNKSVSKFILNLMRLRDEIIGKFLFIKDYKNNLVFNFTRYLTQLEKDAIYFESDITFKIGQNEVVTNAAINRSLQKIYNIQTELANSLQADLRRALPIVINIG